VSAWKRWLFALLGAAVLSAAVLGIFIIGVWIGDSSAKASCLEIGGSWDYTAGDCTLSAPEDL
tara:strand:+ start:17694 stop:17882 length:189 start_codon:yes stop_codon:yes gene_type:complete